jgi:hypothetical protein
MLRIMLLSLALAGCAANTGVQPFAGDVFYVSRQGATGASSQSDLRGAAMNEARAFCEQRQESFDLVELIEARPPYILGNFPKAEVRFRCV